MNSFLPEQQIHFIRLDKNISMNLLPYPYYYLRLYESNVFFYLKTSTLENITWPPSTKKKLKLLITLVLKN